MAAAGQGSGQDGAYDRVDVDVIVARVRTGRGAGGRQSTT